jgi:hypothetical protein
MALDDPVGCAAGSAALLLRIERVPDVMAGIAAEPHD